MIRAPTTGCPSVGLAPMMIAAPAASMSSKDPVAPESPNERRIAYDVGEWHTREQLSTLFVPIAARIRRCIAQQSSFVAREEARPAIASGPWRSRISPNSAAIRARASSQVAARTRPSSRISGVVSRSRERENWWAKRPLRHVWPRLAGPSRAGVIETTRPPAACASRRQPTPQ